jgi:membrane glycosyltransferase
MRDADIRMTPAGIQSRSEITRRRRIVAILSASLYLALVTWLASVLGYDGWSELDIAISVSFVILAPWTVIGFCNAALGLWLLHFRDGGIEEVAPFQAARDEAALRARTAILMTIRNEEPTRVFARLEAMKESLDSTGESARFDWFVLSDTSDAVIADKEEAAFALWRARAGGAPLFYRRRSNNFGYKAGNIRDFCERWGRLYEFMIPLDADSLMDGETILRLVRIGEAYPRIGILQSLVVGAPSSSAFARIFQFGMRHGMRTYTLGAAWWIADCGPYWGHNALVRVAPFYNHCALPKLKNGRQILSHDQIEAALMRRAGYEVRVLPVETGSYEDNPPNLSEFVRRELRWCQGNMQYLSLLRMSGFLPTSRFQLIWAINMFVGAPAWTMVIALAPLEGISKNDMADFSAVSTICLFATFLMFHMAPKLAGLVDVALTPGAIARYGGVMTFIAGAIIELVSSPVVVSVTTFSVSLRLATLVVGRSGEWRAQIREVESLSWRAALGALWPQLGFGTLIFALGAIYAPQLLLWSLPVTLGYLLAVPFAVLTASPRVGALFRRWDLCATPEEVGKIEIFANLQRALKAQTSSRGASPTRLRTVAEADGELESTRAI